MITVVLPVYNRAAIVGRTLRSLEQQSEQPERIILVDNNSTDGTVEVLRAWAADKPHVEVLEELRPGAAEARNCGFARVTTPYVLFFDSDDEMPCRHIEEVSRALREQGFPPLAAFDMELYQLSGQVSAKPFRKGNPLRQQIFHSLLSTQRCVISTELLRRSGGWPENCPVWDDYLLGITLLTLQPAVAYIALTEPVRVYAQAQSITGTDYSSRAGQWEAAMERGEAILREAGCLRGVSYLRWRRAIICGFYLREERPDLVPPLPLRHRLVAWLTALGARGLDRLIY